MASNDYDEHDTDDSKDEDSDSGYVITDQIPRIRQIQGNRLNTVEDFMNELDTYKKANEQLRAHIFKLNRKVITSEQKFRKERTLLESTKKVELMKKDNNIQQAMVKFEKMQKRNTALLGKIKEYETTIKVLETNEKELKKNLAAFKDEKTKKLIESESRKTEDNDKELQDLKQRLKDLETKLEEKNKVIAMKISEDNKVSETLERNTKEVKDVKAEMTKMAQNVDNMKQTMNHILSAVQALGNNSPNEPGEDKTTSNDHEGTIKEEESDSGLLAGATNADASAKRTSNGKQQTDMSRSRERVTKLPPLANKRSKSPDKPPWHHPGGQTKKK